MLPTLVDPGEARPYRAMFEFAELLDRLGYHMATVAHHSFTPAEADPSAPFVVLGAIASRTERLRLGTGIYLAALHHPATVAEQAATLDQVSGGRAVLGVAVGYRPYEFEGFGLDFTTRGRRLEESLRVMRSAWETGTYGSDGEHFAMPEVEVAPPCVQQPHVPILVGGSAPAALSRAARLGDGWFALPQEALNQMADQVALYRQACVEAGREPYVVLMRNAWIADDAATVAHEWMGAMVRFHQMYSDARAAGESGDVVLERLLAGDDIAFADYVRGRSIAGSPAMCIEEIRRWNDAIAPDEYSLIFGGSTEEARLRSAVEQFAAEVMPAFTDGRS
jgi:probable F420-dependent oxidoreductase